MKMTQPELGKRIAELRKARGLTQEELVEKCKLSVRTLQRIESGEVKPRSHTIRVIFEALEYDLNVSSPSPAGQWVSRVKEVFNLKTNTMKKLSVFTLVIAATVIALLSVSSHSKAQAVSEVRNTIEHRFSR